MELVVEAIDLGVDLNIIIDQTGLTALHIAARNTDVEIVDMLLAHGANPNVISTDGHGSTPLHTCSIKLGAGPVAQSLVAAGANVNISSVHGELS
jgi:ankyrin repeat protein